MSPEMKSNFDILKTQIDKKFGKGTMQSLTENPVVDPDNVIPTGSVALDSALGVGGYPQGRIIEIYGSESSGKSTLCLEAVASAQAKDLSCVYIDAEHTLDPPYAKSLGVKIEDLTICQPDNGEEALEVANMCVRSGEVGLIIVDSVAALVPKKELEGEITDQSIGAQARMMSKAMRMITGNLNKTNCTIIFVNQIRMKIGVMMGSPKTTSGGNALKFYASQRIEIVRTGSEKEGDVIVSNVTLAKVVKNKVAPPFRTAEFNITFGKGINQTQELIKLGIEDGIILQKGAWYRYPADAESNIAQGKKSMVEWLEENPEEKAKIRQEIVENRGLV